MKSRLALALLLPTAAMASDIGSVMQERNQILRLRYNQDMSTATTPAQRATISDSYKDFWEQETDGTPDFGRANQNFEHALNPSDSSYANSLRENAAISTTLQPTLDYFRVDAPLGY